MNNEDKPVGARVGWKRLSTTYPFKNYWLQLREDRVETGGGGEIRFAYVDGPGAVLIVPVTREGQIVLIKQYRYTVDDILVEVPAGGMHDAADRTPQEMAMRELREEIGATCATIEQITWYYCAVGSTRNVYYVFLAQGVELHGEQELEATEQIEIMPVPAAEAIELARSGSMKAGDSALALLLCERRLKEEGYL